MAHTLIVLDEQAQATFAEDFTSPEGTAGGFSSRVTEIILGQEANLRYVGVQRWGKTVHDFHTERALLGRDATVVLETVELGSALSKGRVEAVFAGDGGNAKILGLYIEDGRQHLDRYTLQDHRAANCTSDLLFKGVLTDKARSVFSGLIRVAPNARKTAAYQQNRNLLLSRAARADSIPNLEIGSRHPRLHPRRHRRQSGRGAAPLPDVPRPHAQRRHPPDRRRLRGPIGRRRADCRPARRAPQRDPAPRQCARYPIDATTALRQMKETRALWLS